MRNASIMNRRGSAPAPLTMQAKTLAAIRGIIASAGLEGAESWSFGNIGDFTVTRPGSFKPLFTIHVDFQDERFGGGVVYAGERIVNATPHRDVAGGKVEMVRERSFHARYAEPGAMDKALGMIRTEAQRYAPSDVEPLDRPAALELGERLNDAIKRESVDGAFLIMLSYLAERAVETGDDALLTDAVAYFDQQTSPRP